MLEFSRVGRLDFAIRETDLNDVVEEVLDSLRINLKERGVEVRIPRPLPIIQGDRVRIGEVFRNLITNAMKYNDKPEKWIEIGHGTDLGLEFQQAKPGEDCIRHATVFYVRDNGIGIPEKHYEAIFRIFKRLHARDEFGGGTGVGLTIVKKIIERHGGRIWVQSRPGEGTCFYFTLVGSGITMPSAAPHAARRGQPRGPRGHHPRLQESGDGQPDSLLRRTATRPSTTCSSAASTPTPRTAPRPNLILLDLNMPGTDGREVLAEVKKSDQLKSIPVIVLTTSTDERDIEGCYQMGANSYVKKPVDLEGFMQSVQRLKDYWFEVVILPKTE